MSPRGSRTGAVHQGLSMLENTGGHRPESVTQPGAVDARGDDAQGEKGWRENSVKAPRVLQ